MKSYWLVLNDDGTNKYLKIIDNLEAVNFQVEHYRISPIFPVSFNFELPDFSKKVYIQFYFVHHPFTSLVEILRCFRGFSIEKHIWISHGLASILYISGDENEKHIIENHFLGLDIKGEDKLNQNIIAIQEWKYDNTTQSLESSIPLKPKQPSVAISLRDYSKLPSDLRNDIFEFANCIKTVIQRSKIYTPGFTCSFESLIDEMNKIIEILEYLFYPDSIIPEDISDRREELKLANSRLILINELTEEIVQINSTLSYVISQGYTGIVPIEESPCLIHSCSLLGIGTAHKALHMFYKYISNVFSEHPIDAIIEKYYDIPESPKYTDINGPYMQEWQERKEWTIDYYIKKGASKNKNRDLMVCFSGRQGFSESMHYISAAIQSLHLGITNRWNIITSTHEILHSHVHGIYFLIQDRMNKFSWKDIRSFLEQPYNHDFRLIDGISLIMLNFGRSYLYFKQLELEEVKFYEDHQRLAVGVTDESILEDINRATYDVINEIMTHTLDFYYFYQNDPYIYMKQIWLSWAALPTTPSKVQEYVLRSVSAIATLEDDPDIDIRIGNAIDKARDILNELIELDKTINNEIYKAAIGQLTTSEFEILLKACLYLADATKCFLYSRKLQEVLFYDITKKKIDLEDDIDDVTGLDYVLKTGKFEGESITNPVSFMLSMIRNIISTLPNQESETDRYNTLWLFFVCSSVKNGSGGKDVPKQPKI
jgi:hypothetical protein